MTTLERASEAGVQRAHERLVDDAVGDRVKVGRQRHGLALHAHGHGQAGLGDLDGQVVQVGETRTRLGQRRAVR